MSDNDRPLPKKKTMSKVDEFPEYCDFGCSYAGFSDPAAVGACRRDIGVWCARVGQYNTKHARCLLKRM